MAEFSFLGLNKRKGRNSDNRSCLILGPEAVWYTRYTRLTWQRLDTALGKGGGKCRSGQRLTGEKGGLGVHLRALILGEFGPFLNSDGGNRQTLRRGVVATCVAMSCSGIHVARLELSAPPAICGSSIMIWDSAV